MKTSDKLILETINLMIPGKIYKIPDSTWNEIDSYLVNLGYNSTKNLISFIVKNSDLVIYWENNEIKRFNPWSEPNLALALFAFSRALRFALSFSFINKELLDEDNNPLTIKPKIKPQETSLIDLG